MLSRSMPTSRELLIAAVAALLALTVTNLIQPAEAGGGDATTDVVFIATGANFPDALGAGPAGGVLRGPVLLVTKDTVPAATLAELNRLAPKNIVIVGGTAVISEGVKNELEGLAFAPSVSRIAGSNRYETAAALSAATFPFSAYEVIEVELIIEEATVENPAGTLNTQIIDCPSRMAAIGGFWRVADRNQPSPVSSNGWQPGYPDGETWVVPTSYRDPTTVAEWQGNTFVRVVCAA